LLFSELLCFEKDLRCPLFFAEPLLPDRWSWWVQRESGVEPPHAKAANNAEGRKRQAS
jgi:hypothetical protein